MLAIAALVVLAGLAGCSMLPSGSPTALEFHATGDPDTAAEIVILDLNPDIAKITSGYRRPGLAGLGNDSYRPSLILKPGDVISISIYEVTPIPLFGAAPALQTEPGKVLPVNGHISTLPPQVVEQDGTIPVPFAGSVRVGGLTPSQAGKAVAKALEGKATNPQAVVSLVSTSANVASVNGDVNRPGQVQLTVRGERVLDVLAIAGGPKDPTFDTDIELVRNGRIARANMQQIVSDPAQNLRVQPGDNIVAIHNPRTFTVLGAPTKASQFNFDVEKVNLAEALARSGGLNDTIADVGNVYLLRFEPCELMRRILKPGDPQLKIVDRAKFIVPVAYHIDLRGASGYFVSQAVQMRDKDVVLVANAESVQLSKAAVILRNIAGIYYDFRGPEAATTSTRSGTVTTTVPTGGAD